MVNYNKRKKLTNRRHNRSSRMSGGSPYNSASSYGMYVNGTTDDQFMRTMSQSGQYGSVPGNTIIGAQGQNAQRAGSRRKRGGFIGEVVNQAIVPLSILAMQQTYRKRKHGGKTKKHKRR